VCELRARSRGNARHIAGLMRTRWTVYDHHTVRRRHTLGSEAGKGRKDAREGDSAEGERADARGLVHFVGRVVLAVVRVGFGVGGGLAVPGSSGRMGPDGNTATMAGLVRYVRAVLTVGNSEAVARGSGGELARSGTRI
jgi:hypothetical protein